MAEIKTAVSGELTMQKVVGTLTLNELLDSIREFYAGKPTKHVVWDLTEALLGQLKFEDLEYLAAFAMQFSPRRTGGKTAIVAPDDLGYGLGRIVDSLAASRNTPVATYTFRQAGEAAKWFGVDSLPVI